LRWKALDSDINTKDIKEALDPPKIETTMTYLEEHEQKHREAIRTRGPSY